MKHPRVYIGFMLLALVVATQSPLRAGPVGVEPPTGQTVGELLQENKGEGADALASLSNTELWLRLSGLFGLLTMTGLALYIVTKRRRRQARFPENGGISILARAALSPKHTVFLVASGGRRIMVGVSGERMVTLATLDEEPAAPLHTKKLPPETEEAKGTAPKQTLAAVVETALASPPEKRRVTEVRRSKRSFLRKEPEEALSLRLRDSSTGRNQKRPMVPLFGYKPISRSRDDVLSDELAAYRERVSHLRSFLDESPVGERLNRDKGR